MEEFEIEDLKNGRYQSLNRECKLKQGLKEGKLLWEIFIRTWEMKQN